jgi:hypothetical protein
VFFTLLIDTLLCQCVSKGIAEVRGMVRLASWHNRGIECIRIIAGAPKRAGFRLQSVRVINV